MQKFAEELDITGGEVEFDLIQIAGLTSAQINVQETRLSPIVENKCSKPAFQKFAEAEAKAEELVKTGSPLIAGERFVAEVTAVDQLNKECLRSLGVKGGVYVVTAKRGAMSFPQYAHAAQELLRQAAANHSASRTSGSFWPTLGCGSRGGPGYRLPSGKCASWRQ